MLEFLFIFCEYGNANYYNFIIQCAFIFSLHQDTFFNRNKTETA